MKRICLLFAICLLAIAVASALSEHCGTKLTREVAKELKGLLHVNLIYDCSCKQLAKQLGSATEKDFEKISRAVQGDSYAVRDFSRNVTSKEIVERLQNEAFWKQNVRGACRKGSKRTVCAFLLLDLNVPSLG